MQLMMSFLGKLQLAQMDVEEIEMEEAEADYSGLA